jgi:hypothetical protein
MKVEYRDAVTETLASQPLSPRFSLQPEAAGHVDAAREVQPVVPLPLCCGHKLPSILKFGDA